MSFGVVFLNQTFVTHSLGVVCKRRAPAAAPAAELAGQVRASFGTAAPANCFPHLPQWWLQAALQYVVPLISKGRTFSERQNNTLLICIMHFCFASQRLSLSSIQRYEGRSFSDAFKLSFSIILSH